MTEVRGRATVRQSRWFSAAEIAQTVSSAWGGVACSPEDVGRTWPPLERALRERGLERWGPVLGTIAAVGALSPSFRLAGEYGDGEALIDRFIARGLPVYADRGDWEAIRDRVSPNNETWTHFLAIVRRLEGLAAHRQASPRPRLRPGQVVRGAISGYCTDAGTHGGFPAADIFAPEGTPVYAPVDGVSEPELRRRGGFTTRLQGEDGRTYYLAHGAIPFMAGRVERGQLIGRVGSTGSGPSGYASSGGAPPHLHLAIADDGNVDRGDLGGSGNIWVEPAVWGGGARRPRGKAASHAR